MRNEQDIIQAAADSIKAYTLAHGYNGVKLAAAVYRTPPAIYRWLNGQADVGIVALTMIAELIGVGIDELTGGGTMLHYMGFDIAQLKDGWVYIFKNGKRVYSARYDHRLTIEERRQIVDEKVLGGLDREC